MNKSCSNFNSTSASNSDPLLMCTSHKEANPGLSPLQAKDKIKEPLLESISKHRRLISGAPFVLGKDKTAEDRLIKAFEFGFLKQRKRSVINMKLHQIKESSNRSEAIQSVLEYTVKAGKDQIIEDLKKLERDFKIKNIEESLFADHIEGSHPESFIKSSKEVNAMALDLSPVRKNRRVLRSSKGLCS
uniref:Uncharacterized protein n=1 Tax=Euplotes harpa TaxID=151035 RepID=A0A7S3ND87_9SPIT|mmetsp:Transcript_39046/g.44666  ORF Transcript_39046/g.44666 Transcript_39046/m.44666 type:complete len:188 (+) Transcript_39046:347-910(+)|eukprot:CAMPEP_0168320170 /NCGR_PEP_ID=MMETSP0213-20121227/1492_1 /TAXON_ID=151035 /ORGANISM="Euplotes harpa, Strain FSP1.4" /LENGTH=187 /DNA_ID=CAMNT_0008321531 /DNA_START=377 /DNA_END=940 /DNA_ORIENTATION=+